MSKKLRNVTINGDRKIDLNGQAGDDLHGLTIEKVLALNERDSQQMASADDGKRFQAENADGSLIKIDMTADDNLIVDAEIIEGKFVEELELGHGVKLRQMGGDPYIVRRTD